MRTRDEDQPREANPTISGASSAIGLFNVIIGLLRRRVVFGTYSEPGAIGSVAIWSRNIPHGQGRAPLWCMVWSSTGTSGSDSSDPIVVSRTGVSTTDIAIRCRTATGGGVNFPGNVYFWIGIF